MKAKQPVLNPSRALAKRRAAYSLAAGAAAVTVGGSAADAAVVYSGLQDLSVVLGAGSQSINLDGDDYKDIYLKNYIFGGTKNYQGLTVAFSPGKVAGFVAGPHNFKYISALGVGTLVDASSLGPTFYGTMGYAADPNAQFNTAANAFIGFSFPIGGQTAADLHNAWMRVSINNAAGTLVIHDWAYDNVPTAGIKTGDKGVPGDYNHDGVVNGDDYTTWQSSFASNVFPGSAADGSNNGIVDAADYTVWRDHLSQSPGVGAGASAAVPEPATLGMLAAGAGGILLWRRRRRGTVNAD